MHRAGGPGGRLAKSAPLRDFTIAGAREMQLSGLETTRGWKKEVDPRGVSCHRDMNKEVPLL